MFSILAGPFTEWVVQVLTYEIVMLTCPKTAEYLDVSGLSVGVLSLQVIIQSDVYINLG